jgi:hypothetical protein
VQDGRYGCYDENKGLKVMRKHAHHGWQWTPAYGSREPARYVLPRRANWDLRCEDTPCADIGGRKTQRWKPRKGRWRAGGSPL